MTDAHTPRVLSDADSAADLAGLPRPDRGAPKYASEANTEELLLTSKQPDALHLADALEKSMQYPLHGKAADMLRTLVSERDALAVRVRELEDLRLEAVAEGFESIAEYVANLRTSASTYFAERNSARDVARKHRKTLEGLGVFASKEQP